MNKIYKVIWSKVKNCHIVVSEIAGACGRSSTRGAKRAAAAMAVLCLLSAGGSELTLAAGTEALKYLAVSPAGSVDQDAVATGGGSVAVGQGSLADGHQGTALGLHSHAGEYGFAGGSEANAVTSGVAVGYEAKAAGAHSIAIGDGRRIDQANRIYEMAQAGYSVAIGSSSHVDKDSNSAIALGVNADVINSAAATALGAGAKVENVAYGLALGGKASVIDGDYGVALGAFSIADRAGGVSGYDPSTGKASTDASLAWKSADGYGALSIGNDFKTRQIINVAAGSQDTDAVNVAQLKALDTKIGTQITNLSTRKTPFVSINGKSGDENVNGDGATGASAIAIGPEVTAKGDYGVALGGWTHAAGNKGIAVGVLSNASANQSMAIGVGANASANDTVAIGTSTEASVFNAIALGASAKSKQSGGLAAGAKAEVASTGYNGIAVGANAYVGPKTDANPPDHSVPGDGALVGDDVNDKEPTTGGMTEQNAMAIGQNAKAFGYQNTSIGAGAETHDTNTLAVGILAVAKGHYSVAIGKQAKTFAEKAIAAGWHASADEVSAAAYGERAHAEKANSLALGANARAMEEASVALGSGSLASGAKDGKAVFSGEEVSAKAGIVSVGNPTYKITPTGGQETEVQASYRRITNMAGGIDDHDAVNVAQLKSLSKKTDDLDAFNVKYDKGTDGKVNKKSITLGDTVIHGVAEGKENTDAVNVAQLKKAVAGAADGNTTYTLEGKENKDNNTTTITFTGSDSTKTEVTVATKDTTLKAGSSGLSVADGKLNMTVEDTSGNTVTGSVDLSAIAAGAADGNTTYILEGKENKDNNTTTITLTGSDNKKTEVTVATKDTRNTVKAGENVKLTETNNALGGTEYTIGVKADGKVENGNTGIVTGGTVYNETRVKEDGTYVKQANSAGDNLTLLDKQVAGNTSSIASLQNNFHEIDRNLSKVGAGAAALAALHPLDFDPEDKWDFSAGFGNYRDASAVAVGAFYRPNERTMLSIGATLGDNRNLFNAGLSVKLGSGKAPASMSRAHMVETIRRQENEIQAMKAKDAERDARDAERDAQLEAVMKELKALKAEK
ncbi:MAG: ESPR-type extended signal peptide-containing protein [Dialister sp.]|nr:ESPR-type extended signal peptide-containing protein [Dialister sp.]